MKQTINESDFHAAFERLRPDNFSYEGRSLLFEFLEEFESATGEECELDVIAICCDWTEADAETIIQDYGLDRSDVLDALGYTKDDLYGMDSDEQSETLLKAVEAYLQERTLVAGIISNGIVYRAF